MFNDRVVGWRVMVIRTEVTPVHFQGILPVTRFRCCVHTYNFRKYFGGLELLENYSRLHLTVLCVQSEKHVIL